MNRCLSLSKLIPLFCLLLLLSALPAAPLFAPPPAHAQTDIRSVLPERAESAKRGAADPAAKSSGLTALQPLQRLAGTDWPRTDLNFRPSSAVAVAAGDVDGDGVNDWLYRYTLVADDRTPDLSDRVTKTLLVFGNGDFTARYYDEQYYADLTPVGDFTGDGRADAIEILDVGFRIYEGTASGYSEATVVTDLVPPSTTLSGDVDGDGISDLIFAQDFQITVLFGDAVPGGGDVQVYSPTSPVSRSYAAGDVDGDGAAEIVRLSGRTGTEGPNSALLLEVFSAASNLADPLVVDQTVDVSIPDVQAELIPIRLANLDGADLKEIILTGDDGSAGGLATERVLTSTSGQYDATPIEYDLANLGLLGDVNGDGRTDLSFTQTDGSLAVGFGPSNLANGVNPDLTFGTSASIASQPLGDVTGDGQDDIILTRSLDSAFGPRLVEVSSSGTVAQETDFTFDAATYTPDGVQTSTNVGDWNRDGTEDFGLVYTDGRLEIYFGVPTATSAPDVTLTGPAAFPSGTDNGASVATGDFNGNGVPDLAIGWNSQAQAVEVFEAGSTTPIRTISQSDLGVSLSSPALSTVANLGDINNDGTEDLGITLPGADIGEDPNVGSVFLFLGAATLSTQPDLTLDFSSFGIADARGSFGQVLSGIGDINADGIDDFLVGDTDTRFAGADFPSPTADGALFVQYGQTGSSPSLTPGDVVLALPSFNASFTEITRFLGFGGVAVGDFNGDSVPDLAAKPAIEQTFQAEGTLSIRLYYGGSGFDNVVDAELGVPGFLDGGPNQDGSESPQRAAQSFGALTALPPASPGAPNRLMLETINPANALIFAPDASQTAPLVPETILRGPDQNSGLGTGGTLFTHPQSASSAVGDFDDSGQLNVVMGQLVSADFLGSPAYLYELGSGAVPDDTPVATASQTVSDPAADQAVAFPGTGVTIVFASGSTGSATVTVNRFDTSPSGVAAVDERNVSEYRAQVHVDGDLSIGPGTEIRFLVSELGGVNDPSTVEMYKRDLSGLSRFEQVDTRYEPGPPEEIVGVVSRFSEFIFASETNPLPVEFADLQSARTDNGVDLMWTTLSETGNAGFSVERNVDGQGWSTLAFVEGAGTTTASTRYTLSDSEIPFSASRLRYRLRQVDVDGEETLSENIVQRIEAASKVTLHSTFPNPARSNSVTVRYELPTDEPVTVQMYNVLGQRVRSFDIQDRRVGRHEERLDFGNLASGVYFLRVSQNGQIATQRLTVVR